MATGFNLGGFDDLRAAEAASLLPPPTVNPLEALIGGFQQGAAIRNLPQTMANKALNDQLALAIQQAKLKELQQPQTWNTPGGLIIQDPTAPGGMRVVSGSTAARASANLDRVDLGNEVVLTHPVTGEVVARYPKVPDPKTGESKLYTNKATGGAKYFVPGAEPEGFEAHVPGSGAGTSSAKLSEAEKKALLAGVSQAKILPSLITDYDNLTKKGFTGPVAGRVQRGKSKLGVGTEEFATAQSTMKGNLFNLARALQGPGVLTKDDLLRMEEISPSLTSQKPQFVGELKGVARLMLNGVQSFIELNAGRMDAETLKGIMNAESQLSDFIASGGQAAPPPGTPTKIGRFNLIP